MFEESLPKRETEQEKKPTFEEVMSVVDDLGREAREKTNKSFFKKIGSAFVLTTAILAQGCKNEGDNGKSIDLKPKEGNVAERVEDSDLEKSEFSISDNQMRKAKLRLISDYDYYISSMTKIRRGDDSVDIRKMIDHISNTKENLLWALSDSVELSTEQEKEYEDIIKEIDYAGLFRLTLGQVAIMEKTCFDAYIGQMKYAQKKLQEELDEIKN